MIESGSHDITGNWKHILATSKGGLPEQAGKDHIKQLLKNAGVKDSSYEKWADGELELADDTEQDQKEGIAPKIINGIPTWFATGIGVADILRDQGFKPPSQRQAEQTIARNNQRVQQRHQKAREQDQMRLRSPESPTGPTGPSGPTHHAFSHSFNFDWGRIPEWIGKIGGAITNTNQIINEVRNFGMSPGEIAGRYDEQRYPGTSPWERLGQAGNPNENNSDEKAHQLEMTKLQLLNNARVAATAQVGQIGTEYVRQQQDKGAAADAIKWVQDTIRGDRPALGAADIKVTDSEGNEVSSEPIDRRTRAGKETDTRIEKAKQEIISMTQTRQIEQVRAALETIATQIETGRLAIAEREILIKENQQDPILHAIRQLEQALGDRAQMKRILDSLGKIGGTVGSGLVRAIIENLKSIPQAAAQGLSNYPEQL